MIRTGNNLFNKSAILGLNLRIKMNELYFTEEHNLFRESLQDFLQKEVVPHVETWEETGKIDRFIWKKFGDMGFFGIAYPEEYGGMGLDFFYTVILLEELQKIIEKQLNAMKLAHFDNEEVRKTIGKIIVARFKSYLKIY